MAVRETVTAERVLLKQEETVIDEHTIIEQQVDNYALCRSRTRVNFNDA